MDLLEGGWGRTAGVLLLPGGGSGKKFSRTCADAASVSVE